MTEQINAIEAARRLYTGEERTSSIAPDIVWHVPGHNPSPAISRFQIHRTEAPRGRLSQVGTSKSTM